MAEDEMVGWHHRLNGHDFQQALGVGDGQGSLGCCSPWVCEESDMTERLTWTELKGRTEMMGENFSVFQGVSGVIHTTFRIPRCITIKLQNTRDQESNIESNREKRGYLKKNSN